MPLFRQAVWAGFAAANNFNQRGNGYILSGNADFFTHTFIQSTKLDKGADFYINY
jgi:hypothetical protein